MSDYYSLKKEITDILNNIGLPEELFNVFVGPIHFDGHYYEKSGSCYRYAYFERGKIEILCDTEYYDDIKYCILKDIIKNYAINYELQNRLWYQDTRRLWMEKTLELFKKINDYYYRRLLDEYNEILKEHPFNDRSAISQNILVELYKVISKINIPFNLKLKRKLKVIRSEIKKTINCSLKYDSKVIVDTINKVSEFYEEIKLRDIQFDNLVGADLDFILSIDLNFLRHNFEY